jgi:thioredoxin:protein disulfide reductase
MKYITAFILALSLTTHTQAQLMGKSPFTIRINTIGTRSSDALEFAVQIAIPPEHVIYTESFAVTTDAKLELEALTQPESHMKPDLIDPSVEVEVYDTSIEARYRLTSAPDGAVVTVALQGCDKSVCFMPEKHTFSFDYKSGEFVSGTSEKTFDDAPYGDPEGANRWLQGARLTTAGGYMAADDFLLFLDKAAGKDVVKHSGFDQFLDDPVVFLRNNGVFLTLILVLLGGVLLNLTPCVLPMIPINLAIIGAGTGTRSRGFFRGMAYGLGIVVVYGGLGWLILKLGLFFGAIQSNPWFNLVIGAIFVALSLALFDVFVIDFTRLTSSHSDEAHRKGLLAAFAVGSLSALLAGACVAPVVIAVLLLAGNLYAGGMQAAQFLPFVLGLGMALPWPFAGAGLSVLPSPGMWMVRVKQVFGVLMVLLALYYLYLAGTGFFGAQVAREDSILAGDHSAWIEKVEEARNTGKPILVDFWATWCKNCAVMEKKTFKEEAVAERLQDYVFVKVQAEKPDQSPAREMLEAFEVRGLPGFAVLTFE